MKILKMLLLLSALFAVSAITLYSAEKDATGDAKKDAKLDEKRFQIGFGLNVNTSNLLTLIENTRMYNAISQDKDYEYPGLSDKQKQAVGDLSNGMQKALFLSNMFAGFEYGINMRVLWSLMMIETDLLLLPSDGFYNGRFDLEWVLDAGVRAPFWIMPYLIGGVNFTFSWYPGKVQSIDSWKTWGTINNFVWRPGINARAGLDFKFKHFSVGGYYQYMVKDFQEFSDWWGQLAHTLESNGMSTQQAQANAAGMVFSAQSRLGIVINWYIF